MDIEFTYTTSIQPSVRPDLMAEIAREAFGRIRRVKEELKLARVRMVEERKRLRSTDGVDIEITRVAVVIKAVASLTAGIAAEISDGVCRGREEGQRMAGVSRMGDELRQLAT